MQHNFIAILLLYVLVLPAAVSGENYRYIELSQGFKLGGELSNNNWEGEYPTTIKIGYHWEHTKKVYSRYECEHISNFFDGSPFNNKKETSLDWCSATIGYIF